MNDYYRVVLVFMVALLPLLGFCFYVFFLTLMVFTPVSVWTIVVLCSTILWWFSLSLHPRIRHYRGAEARFEDAYVYNDGEPIDVQVIPTVGVEGAVD